MSKNPGGASILGDTSMGSQGKSFSYNNLCIAENEGQSPRRPFYVEKGFRPEESVVSLFHGGSIAHGIGLRNRKKGFKSRPAICLAFSMCIPLELHSGEHWCSWIHLFI
jgi:hypothetical protein